MAVIINKMYIPERCLYCGLDEGCSYARYNSPFRPSGCPLKSADEMIEEIKTDLSWYLYDENGNETALCKELIPIIKKYCDKEQEDESNKFI